MSDPGLWETVLMAIFVEDPNITKEFYSFLQFLQLQCVSFSFRKLLSLRYSWTKGLPEGGLRWCAASTVLTAGVGGHPIWHSIPQPGGQFVLATTFQGVIAILGFLTVRFRFQKFFLHNSQIVVASISRDIMDVNSSIQRATVGQQIHHLWPWGLHHQSHPSLLGHTCPFFSPPGKLPLLGLKAIQHTIF